MEPIKLAEFDNRDAAHAELARVLAEGTHPKAECREDPNAALPYQVWSGPAPK
jgi:hypothetical protein